MVWIHCSANYRTVNGKLVSSLILIEMSTWARRMSQTLEEKESSGRLSLPSIYLCPPTACKLIISNVTWVRCPWQPDCLLPSPGPCLWFSHFVVGWTSKTCFFLQYPQNCDGGCQQNNNFQSGSSIWKMIPRAKETD